MNRFALAFVALILCACAADAQVFRLRSREAPACPGGICPAPPVALSTVPAKAPEPCGRAAQPMPIGAGPSVTIPPPVPVKTGRFAARKHRVVKAALIARGVPPATIAALQARYGDGSFWAALWDYLLKYGLPALLKLIESWLS